MLLGILFVCILNLLWTVSVGQKKNTKYCAVCRVLVSEAEWLISQVDPKKSIQVGSFRVDPKGNQKTKDKQYARSEVHIEEIIESVCDKLRQYAEITFDDGTSQMVRTVGFNGKRLETKGFKLDRDKGSAFSYKCENFLEDHEEEVIPLLQLENIKDYEKLICGEKLEVCSSQDLRMPLFTLPEAEDDVTVNDAGDSDNQDDGSDDSVGTDVVEDNAENSVDGSSDETDNIVTDDFPSENVDEKTEL